MDAGKPESFLERSMYIHGIQSKRARTCNVQQNHARDPPAVMSCTKRKMDCAMQRVVTKLNKWLFIGEM